jgi:hypothetical protein
MFDTERLFNIIPPASILARETSRVILTERTGLMFGTQTLAIPNASSIIDFATGKAHCRLLNRFFQGFVCE